MAAEGGRVLISVKDWLRSITPYSFFIWSLFWIALFFAGSYLFFVYLMPYVLPFVLALFLAVLIDPWVNGVERLLRVPRGIATALVVLIATALLVLLVALLVAIITYEVSELTGALPQYFQIGLRAIQEGIARYQALAQSAANQPALQGFLAKRLLDLNEFLTSQLDTASNLLLMVVGLPSVIITILITVVATFFLSRDKRIIARFLLSLLPEDWRRQITAVKVDVFESAVGFVKAEFTLVSITGLLTLIFLNLLGVRYAPLIAILAAVLDVLPVLGPSMLFIPWAAFHLFFGSPLLAAKLLLAYGATSGIRTVLEPKILGDRIGLHPLATLIGLYLGLQIFGPIGVIYGPLTLILLKAMVGAGILNLPGSPGGKTL